VRVPALRNTAAFLVPAIALLAGSPAPGAEDLFDITTIQNEGRSVAAQLAELNGDGRTDLFIVTLIGIPPEEERTILVYLQREDGSLPAEPDHRVPVPHWSAVYDVADVRPDSPGEELVLLRPGGATLVSLADASGGSWTLEAPGPTSVGLADDERGFEHFRIVYDDFGEEPWLVVAQIGQLTALSPDGEVKARIAVPRRANYFIIPATGLVSLESDFQIFLDVPKLSIGDVDGDGRADIVNSTRHEIRVFLRRADGGFPFEPSRTIPLRLVTPRDHIRGSGGVVSEIKDIDGDGRVDLLISHVQGTFTDAHTTVYVYMNRDGGWNLGEPDETLRSKASLVSNALFDFDRDGRRELIRLEFAFTLLEFVELLVSREVDLTISIHRFDDAEGFGGEPWMKKSLSLPFSFDTFRLKGFVPTANLDLNRDGLLDFVSSGGGQAIEVYLGDHDKPFAKRNGRQTLATAGVIHFGDYDGDQLPDFVIFDPHNFDVPVRVGRNRGVLPGTPPQLVAQPEF
jgi:hypothetical protein